ncbi:alpha/beta fold hydrolase [Dokdonella sp.]|uniref:alpha/beta fold hydrolase n=1 Tax=Dokdonella sp. TaxID=2291710 RepID=UPI003C4A7A49
MTSLVGFLLAAHLVFGSMAASSVEPTGAEGNTVEVNGIEMHYREQGSGRPLVLLHGFGGCGDNWQPFVAPLAEHYRLIIVDMRGHGHSTNPHKTFTHRQSAKDVFALLDSMDVGRFSAMGMSSGGMTLLHMATRQPDRIESMVLISAAPRFNPQARSIMQGASVENMPPKVGDLYRECAFRGEAQVAELVAQFRGFHADVEDMDFSASDLSRISATTLIVSGDRDVFVPVDVSSAMFQAIPNASLWIVPGGDHVPIYDPELSFSAAALRFLEAPSR